MPSRPLSQKHVLAALMLSFVIVGGQPTSAQVTSGHGGGGRNYRECTTCISAHQENSLRALLEQRRRKMGPAPAPADATGDPQPYTFYPHAGILSAGDAFLTNYTDLDASSGIRDPFCTAITYNGHRGIDTDILYWDMQAIGVPVFAALGGTVIAAHDGEFDQNTEWLGQPANLVVIDHGNGHVTRYFHFKKDSVAVEVNDVVVAGQQIGLVGSSGNSTGPHLHFQTELDSVVTEPFAGPCGPSSSLFLRQPDAAPRMFIRDFTITDQALGSWEGPPVSTTSRGQFVVNTSPQIYFWINLLNMEPNSTYRIRFRRPDGSVAFNGNTNSFSSTYHWSYWWWWYTVNLNVTGTWTLEFSLNGQVEVSCPFEVVASAGQLTNRAPNAAPVVFENPPVTSEVPVCRVATFSVLDDPDYDLVRYRYVWKVNNVVRRDVVSAALSDALPMGTAGAGDTLLCEVTPSDGTLNGPMRSASAQLPGGLSPEITLQQPAGVSLTDAASTIDYGSVALGSGSQRIFTVRNDGSANLTSLSIAINGPDAARFSAGSLGQTSLPPGGTTTFSVTYSPNDAALDTATLQVASNDFDENPFDVGLSGNGIVAEIDVENPSGNGLVDGNASVDFGDIAAGGSSQQVFTIRNSGTAPLNGLSVAIDGPAAAKFSSSTFASTTLAPGNSTTLTVTFSPTSAGAHIAHLHIGSNDIDENPFDIDLVGDATGPEISVEFPPSTPLVDGNSTINFGNPLIGASEQRVITIRNTGTSNITSLSASLNGGSAAMYQLTAISPTTLAPGASTTFTATFTPTSSGTKTTSLQITSSDIDENPFDITLSGVGVAPEIDVSSPPGTNLADGTSTRDFGSAVLNEALRLTFRIRNSGGYPLTGLATSIDGVHHSDFVAENLSSTTLNPGQNLDFDVIFTPSAAGVRQAAIHISSSDADENPFDIGLIGSGGSPDIAVEFPSGTDLTDGVTTAIVDDHLGEVVQEVFVLRNDGNAPLLNISTTIDGPNAADFRVSFLSSTTVLPGEEAQLGLWYDTATIGDSVAQLHIHSGDPDENPFDIELRGTRLQPTTLRSWAESFGLSGAALLPDSDGDTDGLTLLEEYAFRLDPTVQDAHHLNGDSGTSGLPDIRLIGAGDSAFLRSKYLRRRTDPDLVYTVEYGNQLIDAPPDGFMPAIEPGTFVNIAPDFSRVTVDDSVTAGDHPERFGRVKVSYQPSE